MLKKTIIKYHHLPDESDGTREYENCLRKIIRNCHVYSFELGRDLKKIVVPSFEKDLLKELKGIKKNKLKYPFNIMHEEAVKYKKPAVFLERKPIPEKIDSSPQEEKVKEKRKEILANKAEFKDLERELDYLCFKLANEISSKDYTLGKEMDLIEDKMRLLLQDEISLPEEIEYSIFMAAYHNLENYVKDKDNLFILIPEAGSYDQEQLYMDIITSKAIQEHKPYLLNVKYLAELGNSIFSLKSFDKDGIGLSEFKAYFRKYFIKDIKKLNAIKDKKVPYEEFYDLMKNINTDKIADIIKALKQTLGNQIALSRYIDKRSQKKSNSFSKLPEKEPKKEPETPKKERFKVEKLSKTVKLGDYYSIPIEEYEALEEIGKKYFDGKKPEELLDDIDERIKIFQENNYYRITYLDLSKIGLENIPKELSSFTQLEELNLEANCISQIFGLDKLTQLKYLELGSNYIEQIKGLDKLINLQKLSLSGNQISCIEGLENLINLQTLYLGYNNISRVKGSDFPKQLESLELGTNNISQIENLDELTRLTYLWLKENPLSDQAKEHIEKLKKKINIISYSPNELDSWFEEYPSPRLNNFGTRCLIAENYYYKKNFGAAYYYAETVLDFLFFENIKKEFGEKFRENEEFKEMAGECLTISLKKLVNELKPMLDNEEKEILEETNIVSLYDIENLFKKHLPPSYRTYKRLKEWFKNEFYRK